MINKKKLNKDHALLVIDVQNDFIENSSQKYKGDVKDFFPPNLEVNKSTSILPKILALKNIFHKDRIILTQDWHPIGHISFAASNDKRYSKDPVTGLSMLNKEELIKEVNGEKVDLGSQELWPKHCIQKQQGAEFHQEIKSLWKEAELVTVLEKNKDYNNNKPKIIRKGSNLNIDSYSGFGDKFNNKYDRTELNDLLKKLKVKTVVVCGLAFDYCVKFTCLDALRIGFNVVLIKDATASVVSALDERNIKELEERAKKLNKNFKLTNTANLI